MKRCPKCSSLMPDDAVRCIKCGLEAAQKPGPVPAAPRQPPARPAAPARQPAAGAGKQWVARPGKIRGGWELAVQSWRVLMLDKDLLVFPLLSGISCFLVLASFAVGALATGISPFKDGNAATDRAGWIVLFAYYFANYFVIVFFNSALVACAMIRFQGGNPTVGDGLRAASERLVHILAWVTLAATVGVILRIIQERVEIVGKIVIGLLGAAWTIATYFVVPVLVVEKLGPFDTLERSVTLMKETWGESLVSNVGIGMVSFLASLAVVVVVGTATVMLSTMTGSTAVLLVGVVAVIVLLILVALVSSALNTIVVSALYLYAAEGKVPEAFEGVVQHAFVTK